jgi:predicted hydrocarbon binding protein
MYYKVTLKVSTNELLEMVHNIGQQYGHYYGKTAVPVERQKQTIPLGIADRWRAFEITSTEIERLLSELDKLGKEWQTLDKKAKEDSSLVHIKVNVRNKALEIVKSLQETATSLEKGFVENFYRSIIEPLFFSANSPLFLTSKIKDIWSILAEDGAVALPIKDGYVVVNVPEVALTNTCERDGIDYVCTDYHIDLIIEYNGSKMGTIEIYLNNPATATEVLERLASMSNKFESIITSVETENNTC